MDNTSVKTSSPLLIAAAWLLVLVPTGWGLTYTVQNAMKLFTTQPAPTTTVPRGSDFLAAGNGLLTGSAA